MPSPRDVLRERFGFEQFRPGQEEVIGHLLGGHSAAAVFPTGAGKSLCYQLPALVLPGLTVVVSPLIALMKDQIDSLRRRGVPAERLDSTRGADEAGATAREVRAGRLKLLYVAPERFKNERFRALLEGARVALFAVDEAHCISEWGHNFRPDYLKLAAFARRCGAERVLALTATATPAVLEDICRGFDIDRRRAVRTGSYRPNLTLRTTPVSAAERDGMLLDRLKKRAGASVVYVTLQRTAEAVAGRLAEAGLPAKAYHAGMADEERAAVQEWFAGSAEAVVVATIAFGMGIDKSDIRGVYHYNLPKSLENYSQEVGRAGRDGLPAECELFACPDDLHALENFVYGDTPSLDSVRGLVRDVFGRGEQFDVGLSELAGDHDVRELVLNTLLTYLELDGYLEAGTPFYASYKFRPLRTSQEILAGFEGERRQFLAGLFRQAEKAKVWFTLDVDRAAAATGSPRERVLTALDYLAGQGHLELKVADVRHSFRRLRVPDDPDGVARALHRRAVEREGREVARLGQVLGWVGHDGCQVARLAEHFGEVLGRDCGHCTWCLGGGKRVELLPRADRGVDPAVAGRARALAREHPEALGESRALARFLCGLTSPRLARARLSRHELFGALADVPFARVLAWAEGTR
jgi:ATP-dependent DNA helicase RecQ